MKSLYGILGVSRDATVAKIKAAFRKRAKEAHPDKGGSDEELQAINQAWETLGDPVKRARYDETGEVSGPGSTISPGEMMFLQVLNNALKNIVEQGEGSITVEVSRQLSEQHKRRAREHTATKELIARLDKQLGRYINRENGENLIEASLRANKAQLLALSANLDREICALLDAIVISNGYADSAPVPERHPRSSPKLMAFDEFLEFYERGSNRKGGGR